MAGNVSLDDVNTQLTQVSQLLTDFTTKMGAWTNGVVGGGPNKDGKYPLPISLGQYVMLSCPAQFAYDALQPKPIYAKMTSGDTYTLDLVTHKSAIVSLEGPAPNSPIKVNLPPIAVFGWTCTILQNGSGQHQFQLNGGQSMINSQGYTRTRGQGSPMTAYCVGTNSQGKPYWNTFGDMVT